MVLAGLVNSWLTLPNWEQPLPPLLFYVKEKISNNFGVDSISYLFRIRHMINIVSELHSFSSEVQCDAREERGSYVTQKHSCILSCLTSRLTLSFP